MKWTGLHLMRQTHIKAVLPVMATTEILMMLMTH